MDTSAVERLVNSILTLSEDIENLPYDNPAEMASLFQQLKEAAQEARSSNESNVRYHLQQNQRLTKMEQGLARQEVTIARQEVTIETLTDEVHDVRTLLLVHIKPAIEVGKAELRRALIRKLQGKLKKAGYTKQNVSSGHTLAEQMNRDDQWAAGLNRKYFQNIGEGPLWDKFHRFIQDTSCTSGRNEFVHGIDTANYFASALLKAAAEKPEKYSVILDDYAEVFEYTYGTTINDAAAMVPGTSLPSIGS